MASLSQELVDKFVKAVNGNKKQTKSPTITFGTLYRTTVDNVHSYWVELDGHGYVTENDDGSTSKIRIPADMSNIASGVTMVDPEKGTRVAVLLSNHQASVISSMENKDANATTLDKAAGVVVSVDLLVADNAKINGRLDTVIGDVKYLNSHMVTTDYLSAKYLTAGQIAAGYVDVDTANAKFAAIDFANIGEAAIKNLFTTDAFIQNAGITFASIDFSNIGKAAIEQFMATSGLIENVVVGDGTITGNLVGVTIKGDLIEANTLVADKLVIQGEDGLYYKLNTDGVTVEGEQTEYNSLNGSVITAKSITATQISVDDLVAFDATIGGFTIGENSIHSEVKDSEGNTTRGIYMDTDGQVNFGDESNFIKYYKDEDGTYKLAISAASILYALNGKQYSIADLGQIGEYVHVGTYEDEPCIELGESDSDFKLVITNTRIMFMEGSTVPAYINNQSLHITKAVIEEEIQQGEFVWKVRANGNMGLVWKGEA